MIEHALWLASQGFAVFPLRTRDKRPATSDGFKSATKDPEQIRAWWAACPDYNIGIATGAASNVFVVDVDGPEGEAALTAFGPLPETAEAKTGKGRHLLFSYPGPSSSGAGKIGLHIDHRSDGGYIVAPPSIHPNGHRYEWTKVVPFAPLPPAILARLSAPKAPPPLAAPVSVSATPLASVDDVRVSMSLPAHVEALTNALPGTKHSTLVAASTAHARAAHEAGRPREVAEPEITRLLLTALAVNTGSQVNDWASAENTVRSAFDQAYARLGVLMAYEREFSEDGLARRFAKTHGPQGAGACCHVPGQGWYQWDGRRWAAQAGHGAPTELISVMLIQLEMELVARGEDKLATALKAKKTSSNMRSILSLATRYMSVPFDAFDRDPFLLNTPTGTIDLRTGLVRACTPADMITRCTAVPAGAGAPTTWLSSMQMWMCGDASATEYMRVLLGSFLFGRAIDGFWILHGNGFDGKTTVLEVMAGLLGDYCSAASPRSILVRRSGQQQHTSFLGSLIGRRLVVIDELPAESQLDTGAIKSQFGRMPTLNQTGMGKDPVSAAPTAKGLVATNHLPRIDEHDHGTRRRIARIPFDAPLREWGIRKDDGFAARLVAQEGPAILAWLVGGFMSWAAGDAATGRPGHELPHCDRVAAATEELFSEGDLLTSFLATCEHAPALECTASDLYNAYKRHAEENGDYTMSKRAFGNRLRELRYNPTRTSKVRMYKGIRPPASLGGKPPTF